MKRSERNWTIVQIIYHDPCDVTDATPMGWKSRVEKYVVETGLKSEAESIVGSWLSCEPLTRIKHLYEIHYYPRNYVDQADQLRCDGRVIS